MTRKYTQIITHWDAEDAHLVISFLDNLKEALWAVYGQDIMDEHASRSQEHHQTDPLTDLEDDDIIPF